MLLKKEVWKFIRRRIFLGFIAMTILLVSSSVSYAAEMQYWQVSAGNWADSVNWSSSVPTVSDNAIIYNGGTATVDHVGAACSNIFLGGVDSGTLNITDGSFAAKFVIVGNTSSGAINHYSGTNTISSSLVLANKSSLNNTYGTYTLKGTGALSANDEYISYSGIGKFTQSAGTNIASSNILLGFEAAAIGTYILDGPGLLSAYSEFVGYGGTGIFDHSAGTNVVSLYLEIGDGVGSNGTYNLSGYGQLIVSSKEFIGSSGTGIFNHSAGVNTVSNSLNIGYRAGAIGTYSLSGTGELNVPTEYIGYTGTGTFNQNGGNNNVLFSLRFCESAVSTGTYNLNGRTLTLKSIVIGAGTAEFNFGGGTLQASGTFSTSLPMTLTGTGGKANIDTAGYIVTLSGILSGGGGLNKLGSGTLTLSALNSYSGDTIVNGGVLEIASGISSTGTSLIDVQSGKAIIKTTSINKTNLDITTAALTTFEVLNGTHTVGDISGGGITQVDINARLTAASIMQGTLTIGSGAVVVIQPIAGGPLSAEITVVPEPSSFVILVGVFMVWVCSWVWKKRG
jgi:autotransporter-associated beta strand protein